MRVELLERVGSWQNVLNSARTTVNKEELDKEPSSEFKRKILLAEHSPIRQLMFRFRIYDLPSWVSVHLVRHNIGIEHFVSTQRTDRTGVDRDELKQSELVTHEILVNAQAMISISRKRLCHQASKETRKGWLMVLASIYELEPELYSLCVRECTFRGFCPEMKSCGLHTSKEFIEERHNYINLGE